MSDNDNEDEIVELAIKCYDSDSEIDVAKKKISRWKKEKTHCYARTYNTFQ